MVEVCNPHQVNGCLGVAGTFQHALVNGAQGVDVTGTAKVLWLAVRIGQRADGHSAVVHRHACCTAVKQVNGHRKRGAQHRSVVINLHIEVQFMTAFGSDRCAQDASPFSQHEIHLLLCNLFGSDNKVAFVLSVLIVNNDNKFASFQLLDSFIDGIQFDFFHYL